MNNRGFTIIELMVAVGLFLIVVSIAAAVFVQSLRSQKQVVALMAANDNASLTLEQMTREIRLASQFTSTCTRLSFTNYFGEAVSYELNNDAIERNGRPLTAANVKVHYLCFSLLGETVGDGLATRVTIRLGVSARGGLEDFLTRLQTTVSSRVLDG